MLSKVIVIFLGGIFLDLLSTRYTRSVACGQRGTAALLSGVITLANLGIWGSIFQHAETLGIYGAIAMAGGSSIGTLLGFKRRAALIAEQPAAKLACPEPKPSSQAG